MKLNSSFLIKYEVLSRIFKNLQTTNYDDILKLLKELEISYVMDYKLPKGAIITRVRQSEKKVFNNSSEISYNKNPKSFGRANKPHDPVFYGSIKIPNTENSVDTNLWEIIHYLGKKPIDDVKNPTEFTLGYWRVKENLSTVPIIYGDTFKDKGNLFEPLLKKYNEHPKIDSKSRKIIKFLANEFTKNIISTNNDYKIGVAFFELIKTRLKGECESIIYPSMRAKGEKGAYNIAISPSHVEKYLELIQVGTFSMYHKNGKFLNDMERVVEVNSSDGSFLLPKEKKLSKGSEWCFSELERIVNKK